MSASFSRLMEELRRRSAHMAAQVEELVSQTCVVIFQPSVDAALEVIRRDGEIDAAEVDVETEAIRLLARFQPMGMDLRTLCAILKVNSDLERVADCAVNIAERSRHGEIQEISAASRDLEQLCPVVQQILRDAVCAYTNDDAEVARQVIQQDEAIDALYGQINRDAIVHAAKESERLAAYLDLLSVAKNLERIADHATNIAEDVIFLCTGEIVRHQRGKGLRAR